MQTWIATINIHRWKSCMLHYTLHDIHNISRTTLQWTEQNVDLQTKFKISSNIQHENFIIENFETFGNSKISVLGPTPHKQKNAWKFSTRFCCVFCFLILFLFCVPNKWPIGRSVKKNWSTDRLADSLTSNSLPQARWTKIKTILD